MYDSSSLERQPAISIVIPFRNPGLFFQAALQSVFAQTFTEWELLLINDGSTDGSLELAQRLGDPRVKVISDGDSRGLSYRLNQAAQLVRGAYLFRMDADDMMHPDRIASQLTVLKSSSPNTVVGTACYSMDENSNTIGLRSANFSQALGFEARYSFVHPTVAASTEWFRNNPYSEDHVYRRAEDAELWCRTTSHSRFVWIPEPLLFYREVGVFSIANYLAGQEGILDLIRKNEVSRFRSSWLMTKEWTKAYLFRSLAALNCDTLIVRHRYRRLATDEVELAEIVKKKICRTQLPLIALGEYQHEEGY